MTLAAQDNKIALLSNFKNQQKNKNHKQTYGAHLDYFQQGAPNRTRLEAFVSNVYKKYYNADIDQFYPNLLSIETDDKNSANSQQSIKAVAGVRCAADEMLFSEYYFQGNKLESELERLYCVENGKKLSREVVVEVGNLAPANVGQMRWLITSITGFLYSAGFEYIVFTAVPGVYNAFQRMDVPLKVITEAEHSKLPEEIQHKWGSEYYAHKPLVMSGDIVQGFDIMKKNIYSSNNKLIPLFEKACQLGRRLKAQRAHLEKKAYAA